MKNHYLLSILGMSIAIFSLQTTHGANWTQKRTLQKQVNSGKASFATQQTLSSIQLQDLRSQEAKLKNTQPKDQISGLNQNIKLHAIQTQIGDTQKKMQDQLTLNQLQNKISLNPTQNPELKQKFDQLQKLNDENQALSSKFFSSSKDKATNEQKRQALQQDILTHTISKEGKIIKRPEKSFQETMSSETSNIDKWRALKGTLEVKQNLGKLTKSDTALLEKAKAAQTTSAENQIKAAQSSLTSGKISTLQAQETIANAELVLATAKSKKPGSDPLVQRLQTKAQLAARRLDIETLQKSGKVDQVPLKQKQLKDLELDEQIKAITTQINTAKNNGKSAPENLVKQQKSLIDQQNDLRKEIARAQKATVSSQSSAAKPPVPTSKKPLPPITKKPSVPATKKPLTPVQKKAAQVNVFEQLKSAKPENQTQTDAAVPNKLVIETPDSTENKEESKTTTAQEDLDKMLGSIGYDEE